MREIEDIPPRRRVDVSRLGAQSLCNGAAACAHASRATRPLPPREKHADGAEWSFGQRNLCASEAPSQIGTKRSKRSSPPRAPSRSLRIGAADRRKQENSNQTIGIPNDRSRIRPSDAVNVLFDRPLRLGPDFSLRHASDSSRCSNADLPILCRSMACERTTPTRSFASCSPSKKRSSVGPRLVKMT